MNVFVPDVEVLSPPDNFSLGRLANSIVISGNLVVYGWTIYNTKGSAQFANVFDANTLPADTAVPLFSIDLPANAAKGFSWGDNGRRFKTGLVLCNSSTDATKTIGSVDCFFDVQYQRLSELTVPVPGSESY